MPIPVVLSFKVCPPTTEASLILVVIGKILFLDVQAPGSISLLLSWGVLPHTDFAVCSNSRHPVAVLGPVQNPATVWDIGIFGRFGL